MAVTIPTEVPALPDVRQTHIARPVYGRTIATCTDGINSLLGFRYLRYVSHLLPARTTPIPFRTETRIAPRWTLSPLAQWVWVGIVMQADETASGTAQIDATIVDQSTAANIDSITWTPDRGLPTTILPDSPGLEDFVYTPWTTQASGTEPRLLDVRTYAGRSVRLELGLTDIRLYSVAVLEAYQEQVG